MNEITICVPFYQNPDMLALQIETWNRYPDQAKKALRFIVVDDGSPEPARIDHQTDVDLQMYRIREDILWNNTGAKNLAADKAETSHVLFLDIDHVIEPDNIMTLLTNTYEPKTVNIFKRITQKNEERPANTYLVLMNRAEFLDLGMWDEDFAGGYGVDGTSFWKLATQKGFRRVEWTSPTFRIYLGGDANTIAPRDKTRNRKIHQQKEHGVFKSNPRRLRFEYERTR